MSDVSDQFLTLDFEVWSLSSNRLTRTTRPSPRRAASPLHRGSPLGLGLGLLVEVHLHPRNHCELASQDCSPAHSPSRPTDGQLATNKRHLPLTLLLDHQAPTDLMQVFQPLLRNCSAGYNFCLDPVWTNCSQDNQKSHIFFFLAQMSSSKPQRSPQVSGCPPDSGVHQASKWKQRGRRSLGGTTTVPRRLRALLRRLAPPSIANEWGMCGALPPPAMHISPFWWLPCTPACSWPPWWCWWRWLPCTITWACCWWLPCTPASSCTWSL